VKGLEEVIALDDQLVDAYYQLGILYEQKGKFSKAIPLFYRVLELKPNHAATANYLGYSFADRNIRLNEAERLIRIALEEDPDNPAYIDSLGWVFYRQGNYADALAELSKADTKAKDPVIKEHVGDAYWALALLSEGDAAYKNAVNAWNESLRTDPKNKFLKNKINHIQTIGLEYNAAVERLLSGFRKNQNAIKDFSCFFSLSGAYNKKLIRINGVMFYESPDRIRIDLLGPMMNVWCSMYYSEALFNINPDNALDTFFPGVMSDVLKEIVMSLSAYLNGAVVRILQQPGIVMAPAWRDAVFTDNTITAVFSKNCTRIKELEYIMESGDAISVRFRHSRTDEKIIVPSVVKIKIAAHDLNIKIKFKKVKINSGLDASIFDKEKDPKE